MSSLFPYDRFTDYNSILQKSTTYNGPRYYGKYRGLVTNANDPDRMNKVLLEIPSVLGDKVESDWALPCLPLNVTSLPAPLKVGDLVWVEFEHGDPNLPICVGKITI